MSACEYGCPECGSRTIQILVEIAFNLEGDILEPVEDGEEYPPAFHGLARDTLAVCMDEDCLWNGTVIELKETTDV
uniref:Uncharacterized protein n=1 Tax=viral metagenome TaxID=1070528 RepID=A0A6M3Y269_9ZZZZ